uniref:Putative HNH homing endonuclease n=1 Tax=Jenufa perforata TaxID=993091 RepID=A0A0S2LNA7_9CHLO|nr:putative HNH homing endonuclease [Jenufa perforata]ALO62924.1 putative HNH homing endonuclease [Jenufa perforata]
MDDIYMQYIEYLKLKQGTYIKKEQLYRHRILPGHEGGTYNEENVLLITYKEHTLAHYYRFLAYSKLADLKAFILMKGQKEKHIREMTSFIGKLGGKARSKQMKAAKEYFYNVQWQKDFGFKGRGKINVETGHLKRLNDYITENTPQLRSRAGKLGAQACIKKQREEKTNIFDPKVLMQKKGNLKRWGIKINGKRIPYENLSEDFIEYHIYYGTKTEY